MARNRNFASWLSTLSEKVAGIRVEIGNKSTAGSTLGILAIAGRDLQLPESAYVPETVEASELATYIEELARGAGWPEETPKMRLYGIDKKGRSITSFQKTEKAATIAPGKSDTVIMFEQMAHMMGRQLATIEKLVATQSQSIESLSDANTHAMSTTIHMIDGMIESREYAADTAAANAYLETMISETSEPEESAFVGLARDAIATITGATAAETTPDIDIEAVKNKAAEDAFFRMDLESFFKSQSEAEPEGDPA